MSDNKHTGRGNGSGYYIALILCAAAIGITGYLYYRNSSTTEEVSLQETYPEEVIVGTLGEADIPVIATQPQQETTLPNSQPTQPPVKKALQTASPLAGETISPYSMEALSYNDTTRDWRVHNGVDIAAEAGTPVLAAAAGDVLTVKEDDTLGYTVTIRHDGGYTTQYSSLAENLCVAPGDSVALGDTIGYVSDTAIVETNLGDHLHFSVTCQGKPMDPAEFLALGE